MVQTPNMAHKVSEKTLWFMQLPSSSLFTYFVFLESRMLCFSNEDVFVHTAQRRESLNAQEDRVEPCHLSSSLYYGGQDVYSRSTTNQTYPAVSLRNLCMFC